MDSLKSVMSETLSRLAAAVTLPAGHRWSGWRVELLVARVVGDRNAGAQHDSVAGHLVHLDLLVKRSRGQRGAAGLAEIKRRLGVSTGVPLAGGEFVEGFGILKDDDFLVTLPGDAEAGHHVKQ